MNKSIIRNLVGRKKRIVNLIDTTLNLSNKSVFELDKLKVEKNLTGYSGYEFSLIVGCPRSGTTLLQTVLSTSPEIKSPHGEMDFSEDNFSKRLGRMFDIKVEENEQLEKVFKKYAKDKHLLIKRPTAVFYLDTLLRHFPNMNIIHIIRDGRDVTKSTVNENKPIRWPFRFACRQWKKSIKYARRFKDRNYYELKFEDLIKNPENEINSILDFLGLKRISKNKIANFYKNIGNKNRISKKASQPFDKSVIGKGKGKMSEEDKEVFKKIAGDMLIKLGYEEDNEW